MKSVVYRVLMQVACSVIGTCSMLYILVFDVCFLIITLFFYMLMKIYF